MPRMMRAVQVPRPNAPFELIEREIPEPGPGQVRIQVEACGMCHSDVFVKAGHFPGLTLPRTDGAHARVKGRPLGHVGLR